MTDPFLALLAESMRRSCVPHGLLDKDDLHLISANEQLEGLLKEHQITCGGRLFQDYPEVLEALRRCGTTVQMQTLIHAPSARTLEFTPIRDHNGALLALQCICIPLPSTTVDMTDHNARLEKQFQRTLEEFPVNAWMRSPQGEVFWINETANRFSHQQAKIHDPSNSYWISKIHPDDLPEANKNFVNAMVNGIIMPFRYRVRDNDGVYHWHLSLYAPIRKDDGSVLHWVGIGVNIQSFVDVEERLKSQITALSAKHENDKKRLREANNLLAQTQKMDIVSNLAGGVAHDLNNLLFIMSINADLLHKRLDDPGLKESAASVRASIRKAARLSAQLMGFSGRKPQSVSAVDPKQLLTELQDLLEKAVGAETAFSIHADDDLDTVLVDKMFLENSLINLAINARDAVDRRGSIRLAVHSQTVIRNAVEQDFVVFRMHDDGMGMTPEVKAQIFEPFFTTKSPNKGTGLGLPMVKNFVDNSGGFMEVSSEAGVGTTVSLFLPKSGHSVVQMSDEQSVTPPDDVSLLIIDDDVGVRDALAHALHAVGYHNVTTAFNSEYALQFLSGGLKVDLIISDIEMPGKISIAEFLRQLETMQLNVPVIFATGYSEDTVIKEGLLEGKHPVLFKPFTLNELFLRIRDALKGG